MPFITTVSCNTDLTAYIESSAADLTFVYSEILEINTKMSMTVMGSPVPAKTTTIDHLTTNPDKLTINGYLGCLGCSEATSPQGVLLLLKKAMQAVSYSPDAFFTITTNRAQYAKMMLIGVDFRESKEKLQFIEIITNWESANLAGTIQKPSFDFGGVYA
ncbi:MAG: hypothetical protein GKR96_04265 [Gammaproteobacteria bacterium]|nr:hypothetical protein [Gammaproteobacteria bacterium]